MLGLRAALKVPGVKLEARRFDWLYRRPLECKDGVEDSLACVSTFP